jgi:glutathione S-transferase
VELYYAPHTCALASHIALEDAGADYGLVRVDFAANEQRSPDYMAINPKGRVPSLVTARGILTETPAILMFVAQSYPQARLAPLNDAFARSSRSMLISVRPCTSRTRTACAVTAGPTIPPPSLR